MLEDTQELYHGLTYPWGRTVVPSPGRPEKIADGVYWARFPMPMSLDHINIWLLEDEDGWTVVDTCLGMNSAKEIWEQMFAGFMQNRPIVRVICTHLHPDHVGLAGWLIERFGCELWMSREEFLMCRNMAGDTGRPAPEVALRFYRAAGYNEEQLERYKKKFGNFGRAISALPDSFRRLVDRETITIEAIPVTKPMATYSIILISLTRIPDNFAACGFAPIKYICFPTLVKLKTNQYISSTKIKTSIG